MSELNPATVERARRKIDQLKDANDHGDLLCRNAVASGWLAALRVEDLLDHSTFALLMAELNAVLVERGAQIDAPE